MTDTPDTRASALPPWYPEAEHVELLEARSVELAATSVTQDRETSLEFITFQLDTAWYAVAARRVRGVVPLASLTRIPTAPEFFVGVTTLRGEILGLVDLRRVLEFGQVGLADRVQVLVLGDEADEFGLLVDRAGDVIRIEEELTDVSAALSPRAKSLVLGKTAAGIHVIEIDALLEDERLFVGHLDEDKA